MNHRALCSVKESQIQTLHTARFYLYDTLKKAKLEKTDQSFLGTGTRGREYGGAEGPLMG